MAIDTTKFTKLCRDLSKLDLFGDGPPKPPYGAAPTVAKVLAAVDSGSNALPRVYRDNYVTPLKAALPASMTNPDPRRRIDGLILETVTGAVYDHAAGSPVAKELGRFLAVISNLYRTFLDHSARAHISLPAVETLPPLAVFQSIGANGPFTVPVDAMKDEFAVPVGVVSLPSVYRPHPVLWASLAHEVGGHDVLHADDGLLDELAAGLKKMFGGGTPAPGGGLTMNQFLGFLWAWWIDEAASDVYGLLNIGPAFATNLAFFFAALNAPRGGLGLGDTPELRTESGFDPRDPQKLMDVHPTDILRLSLAIGVIGKLSGLTAATRKACIAELRGLIRVCAPGATVIKLSGNIFIDEHSSLPLNLSLPIGPMQKAAERVGAFIATAKLSSLAGHSIQEINTWDENDEQIARQIATALNAGQGVAGQGDDAQLLAGATRAVLDAPEKYDASSRLLEAALDESFGRDAIWHPLQPDRMRVPLRSWGQDAPAPTRALKGVRSARQA